MSARTIEEVKDGLDDMEYDPILRDAIVLLNELAHLRSLLASFTEPRPISELHEDDGRVLAVKWLNGHMSDWNITCYGAMDNFDMKWFTHFYKLPNIQPPKDNP